MHKTYIMNNLSFEVEFSEVRAGTSLLSLVFIFSVYCLQIVFELVQELLVYFTLYRAHNLKNNSFVLYSLVNLKTRIVLLIILFSLTFLYYLTRFQTWYNVALPTEHSFNVCLFYIKLNSLVVFYIINYKT